MTFHTRVNVPKHGKSVSREKNYPACRQDPLYNWAASSSHTGPLSCNSVFKGQFNFKTFSPRIKINGIFLRPFFDVVTQKMASQETEENESSSPTVFVHIPEE